MDLGNLQKSMAIFTLVHTKAIKRVVTEDTSGRMGAFTKVTLHKTLSNFLLIAGMVKED